MSLINSMLRELDARQPGAASSATADAQVRTVPARRRRHPVWISACAAALLAAGGFAGWHLTRPEAARVTTPVTKPTPPETVQASPAPATPATPVTPATPAVVPVARAAPPAAVAEPVDAAQALPATQPAASSQPAVATQTPAAAQPTATTAMAAAAPQTHASQPLAAVQPAPAAPRDKPKAPDVSAMRAAATSSAPGQIPASQAAHAVPAAKAGDSAARPVTAQAMPQAAHRENGNDADAVAEPADMPQSIEGLQRLLREQPRNAKLQTALVGALMDAGRRDEAMRIAREALAQDATQSTLAMTLARLQVERSELQAAIRTLEKSQAYGGERADYQAFLAALLQRDEQHQEAAQHYRAALTKSPQTGVWWLGLGISLQALQREAEALEAFRRAKTAGGLNPELLAFVNGRIEALGR